MTCRWCGDPTCVVVAHRFLSGQRPVVLLPPAPSTEGDLFERLVTRDEIEASGHEVIEVETWGSAEPMVLAGRPTYHPRDEPPHLPRRPDQTVVERR